MAKLRAAFKTFDHWIKTIQNYEKYASWEWRYGEAPKFDMEISTRFDWGGIDLGLKLEKGLSSMRLFILMPWMRNLSE